ncbi:MOSC N-terminal beta barrel domain-containing protein [Halosimplex rubrum]|uniref:MOSC N-terminal beta barrel domain-containing protein n=1 Tax=Halosimplex rubrum TaxID=869889 RepID=A0A7D5PCT4_9EURY|nr:MOSC N-terminal beta barrel domain-containing protein [Halosimplex rubrum]QLH79619.1 MOSC N-terminal beta barrel domain-containing protein [Halosimplex rubrum]
MPPLSEIRVYPVKSLDPEPVESVRLADSGAIESDRRYALFDADGDYVNGKNERRVHRIRSEFDFGAGEVRLREQGSDEWARFDPEADRGELEAWLSEFFGYDVTVRRDDEQGHPDDTSAGGPTLISTATLEAVASWFDGESGRPAVDAAELRRRFRPNLVVDAPAFWEDRLYADRASTVGFSVGGVEFAGVNPCQRCVVPTRDPDTGESDDGFRERFVERRRATLPEWVDRDWYDHFYRLMVNTRVPGAPATLSVGDRVACDRESAADPA